MPEEIQPPTICPQCKGKIMEFKGVSQRTGRPYAFFGCINPDCRWIWHRPTETQLKLDEIIRALRIIYGKVKKIEQAVYSQPVGMEEMPEEEIPIIDEEKEKLKKKMEMQ